jgi:Uma2 family endonuclease
MSELTPSVPDEATRFRVDAYFELLRRGVLTREDRVELLEGVIVEKEPMDPPHAFAVAKLTELLVPQLRGRAHLRPQLPLVIGSHSAPEPDLAIIAGPVTAWERAHPGTALLAIEVAKSSLVRDRLSKSRIYARAGVLEYWIVNLRDRVLEVSRDPDPARGLYRDQRVLPPGDSIAPLALPDLAVEVVAILPASALPPRD